MYKRALISVLTSLFLLLLVVDLQRVSSRIDHYPLASGIFVKSPSNTTYTSNALTLNVSINIIVAANLGVSMTYSLDGLDNSSILLRKLTRENSFQALITGTADLPSLSDGSHNITIYAKHTVNNKISHVDNNTIYFTVNANHKQIPEFPIGTTPMIMLVVILVAGTFYKTKLKNGHWLT